jgi:hypothetical protein
MATSISSQLKMDNLAIMLESWISDPSKRREIVKWFHFGIIHNVYAISRFAAQLALESGAEMAVEFCEMMERHDADTRRERYLNSIFSPIAMDVLQFSGDHGKTWSTTFKIVSLEMAQRAVEHVDSFRNINTGLSAGHRYRIFRDPNGISGRVVGVIYD